MILPKPPRTPPKPRSPLKRGKRPSRVRKTPIGALRKRMDALFNRYVRKRDGPICISCGRAITNPSDHNAGHFFRCGFMNTRWHPQNVNSQCAFVCNFRKRGNLAEYAIGIVAKYGAGVLAHLDALRRIEKKWRRDELEEMISALETDPVKFECLYFEKHVKLDILVNSLHNAAIRGETHVELPTVSSQDVPSVPRTP